MNSLTEKLPIIFIHGQGSSSATWDETISACKKENIENCYALELRGHGATDRGDLTDFTIQNLAKDIWNFCDRNHLDKIILVGHSMGSRVAVVAATQRSDRIAGLMIIDMEMEPRKPRELPFEEFEKLRNYSRFIPFSVPFSEYLQGFGYTESKIQKYVKEGRIKQVEGGVMAQFDPYIDYLGQREISSSIEAKKNFPKLEKESFPVCLLIPENDSSVSTTGMAWMQNHLDRLKIRTIENSDHRIHKTNFPLFKETLLNFYSECEEATKSKEQD